MRLDRQNQQYHDAIQHIYGLAHNVCITGREQQSLVMRLQQVEIEGIKDGCNGKVIVKNMIATIMDGLMYGNWPWIVNGVNTLNTEK